MKLRQSLQTSKFIWQQRKPSPDQSSLGLVHEKVERYGIKGYVIPKAQHLDNKDRCNPDWKNQANVHVPKLLSNRGSMSKRTYLDDVILANLKRGAPPTHEKLTNWGEHAGSTTVHGHAHKDEFKKQKRLTTAGQIEDEAKRRKQPAPGQYEPKKFKPRNVALTISQPCAVADEATYQGM